MHGRRVGIQLKANPHFGTVVHFYKNGVDEPSVTIGMPRNWLIVATEFRPSWIISPSAASQYAIAGAPDDIYLDIVGARFAGRETGFVSTVLATVDFGEDGLGYQ